MAGTPPYFESFAPEDRLEFMLEYAVGCPDVLNDGTYFEFFSDALEVPAMRWRMSQILREKHQNVADFFFALRVGRKPARAHAPAILGRQLWTDHYPPPQWAIHDLLAVGATLFGGRPKRGKTFAAIEMAHSVAYNQPCFGQYVPIPGNVLYFALEDYAGRIHRRLHQMYQGIGETPYDIYWHFSAPRITEGFVGHIEACLEAIPDVKLIVIDTLRCIRDGGQQSSNLYQEDADTIGCLNTLGQSQDLGIVITHHTRKARSDDVFELFNGTSGLTGSTSQNAVLERSNGDITAMLRMEGKDLEHELHIGLKQVAGGRWMFQGEGEQYQLSETARILRAALVQFGALTIQELASETGLNYDQVRKMLMRLRETGQVTQGHEKRWAWEGLDGDGIDV